MRKKKEDVYGMSFGAFLESPQKDFRITLVYLARTRYSLAGELCITDTVRGIPLISADKELLEQVAKILKRKAYKILPFLGYANEILRVAYPLEDMLAKKLNPMRMLGESDKTSAYAWAPVKSGMRLP